MRVYPQCDWTQGILFSFTSYHKFNYLAFTSPLFKYCHKVIEIKKVYKQEIIIILNILRK